MVLAAILRASNESKSGAMDRMCLRKIENLVEYRVSQLGSHPQSNNKEVRSSVISSVVSIKALQVD